MADSYVCSGAMMRCTMGTSPAKLTVLPIRTVFLTGQPMANISDHLSMVNLAPFGLCRSMGFPSTASATAANHGTLTPMPCMHNTPYAWMNGKNDYIVKGDPALLKSSTCQCIWGGVISIIDDGQHGEGTQFVPKQPREEFSSLIPELREINGSPSTCEKDECEGAELNSTFFSHSAHKMPNSNLVKHNVPSSAKKVVIKPGTAQQVLKSNWNNYTQSEQEHIVKMAEEMPGKLNTFERLKKAENCLEIEKALGIKKGPPMTIEQADKQNANPKHSYQYIADPNGPKLINGVKARQNPNYDRQYSINCATCSAAYALRLLGFDIKAKGKNMNTINEWLSDSHSFDIWDNADGTKAIPTLAKDWIKQKKISKMTGKDYKNYFEETWKEEGVYVVTVKWKEKVVIDSNGNKRLESTGAHATILQRDSDGILYYIEPQVYQQSKGADGRRSIDSLIYNSDGNLKLTPSPPPEKGIMRIDNKLFRIHNEIFKEGNTSLFEI